LVVVDDGSSDATAIAAVCRRFGARLVRRERAGGPAAARNEGLAHVKSELVAFLDSDCVAPPDWIERLAGHFDDPRVAAVAPLVRGRLSPLDMGPRAAEVGPGRRVAYVPSAALVVRRAVLGDPAFDPGLRYGEDVDLAWRLVAAGWRVRYEPDVVVQHAERDSIRRRFLYGTSAAPLARRHPGKLRHVIVRPWPAATLALLAVRRPRAAVLAYAAQTAILARLLRSKGVPGRLAPLWTARALARTATQFARLATPYGAGVAYGYANRRGRSRIGGLPTISGPSNS
jgi:GT2 family glycosyltransferase